MFINANLASAAILFQPLAADALRFLPGISAVGSAFRSGRKGREFEPHIPDLLFEIIRRRSSDSRAPHL